MGQNTPGIAPMAVTTVELTGAVIVLKAPAVTVASVVKVEPSATVAPSSAPGQAQAASTATIDLSSHATPSAPEKCAEVRGGNETKSFRCHRGPQRI